LKETGKCLGEAWALKWTDFDRSTNGTTLSAKSISFGSIDMTFENGRIETLSFKFNRIDMILFAQPEE
jgi:hypothetical protein